MMPTPPIVRTSTVVVLLGLAAFIVVSFATLPLAWSQLFSAESARSSSAFIHSFAPPDVSPAFLRQLAIATQETLAMSALGTLIAALFGILLALPASGRYGNALRAVTRIILNGLRSVPELKRCVIRSRNCIP